MTLPYMSEPWFAMLQAAITASDQSAVARALGRSPSLINQVIHGKGAYGTGAASTEGIAKRVLDTFGNWPCPFLGDGGSERIVSATQCRSYAHRDPPAGSPRDLAHWRACRTCANRERSAPPAHRPVVPRPRKAEPDAISTPHPAGDAS